MNIFVTELSRSEESQRIKIEDNVGESIHIHLDNLRFEYSIPEFLEFSSRMKTSLEKIEAYKEEK